jgi:hypothetical protein
MCDATIRRSNVLPARNLGIEGKRNVSRWVVQSEKMGKSGAGVTANRHQSQQLSRQPHEVQRKCACSALSEAPQSEGIRERSRIGSGSQSPARSGVAISFVGDGLWHHNPLWTLPRTRSDAGLPTGVRTFGRWRPRIRLVGVQLSGPVVRATEHLIVDDAFGDVASEELVTLARHHAIDDASVASALLAAPARRGERQLMGPVRDGEEASRTGKEVEEKVRRKSEGVHVDVEFVDHSTPTCRSAPHWRTGLRR